LAIVTVGCRGSSNIRVSDRRAGCCRTHAGGGVPRRRDRRRSAGFFSIWPLTTHVEPGLWATLLGVLRSRPSSNQGVDQSLALLMIENFGVGVRAKETAEDGLELADGHTAVGGHGDELGERR
jgi:hypothetical protein